MQKKSEKKNTQKDSSKISKNDNKSSSQILLDPSEEILIPPSSSNDIDINLPIKENRAIDSTNLQAEPESFKTIIYEPILEFDLSDPITEPTFVSQPPEENYNYEDNSIIRDDKSEDNIFELIKDKSQNEVQKKSSFEPNSYHKSDEEVSRSFIDNNTIQDSDEIKEQTEIQISEASTEQFMEDEPTDEEDEIKIETGENLLNLELMSDKIYQIIMEENELLVNVDISSEHIILINSNEDYMKYQHTIMDNKCVSFFWPSDESKVIGHRISITTEKGKSFVIDLDKMDISLLNVLTNTQRPIKVFFNAKPVIKWCKINNLNLKYIFDITTALNILKDGKKVSNSLKDLLKRYANWELSSDELTLHDFVFISKFLIEFRKNLVKSFEELGIMDILNLEQNVLFALADSEINGIPYKEPALPLPLQNIWELIESKHGISSKNDLAKIGILSLSKSYLKERKDLLEVNEYINVENSERIRQNFDQKYVKEGRIFSTLVPCSAAGIETKEYSFEGEGIYPFIAPPEDSCLVEGKFNDLEVRIIAKLLNKSGLIQALKHEYGPYAYFAAPLFDKNIEDVTIDEKFIAKIIFETVIHEFGERETLFHVWNTSQTFMKEDEIISLQKKFKKVHPELTQLIQKTKEEVKKGYVTIPIGRISIAKNKGFYRKIEMYMNDIFKRALVLSHYDLETYNAEFSPKIKLCTLYNRIITLECNKRIVNIAIDILTRNMIKAAKKVLKGIPISVKVYATDQWEA